MTPEAMSTEKIGAKKPVDVKWLKDHLLPQLKASFPKGDGDNWQPALYFDALRLIEEYASLSTSHTKLREALEKIARLQTRKPEFEQTDNAGDDYDYGVETGHYNAAQIARAALADTQTKGSKKSSGRI